MKKYAACFLCLKEAMWLDEDDGGCETDVKSLGRYRL